MVKKDLEDKINIGIIGPGEVILNFMLNIAKVAKDIKSIAVYNHYQDHKKEDIEKKLKGYERTVQGKLRKIEGEYPYSIDFQLYLYSSFDLFMDSSDVLIYNVGKKTPQNFLKKRQGSSDIPSVGITNHFSELEGMLEREGSKAYLNQTPIELREKEKENEYISQFITAYHILSTIKDCQAEGYFEKAERSILLLPAIIPLTIDYAQRMRDYFEARGLISKFKAQEIDNLGKFLIVNANSSENNLDVFLSILPEMKRNAVSLAIDSDRLTTLFNDLNLLEEVGISKPFDCDISAKVTGNHDSDIIPNFEEIPIQPYSPQYKEKIDIFKQQIKENRLKLHQLMKKKIINYYRENKDYENLPEQAGEGLAKIIQGISDDKILLTSGYFMEIEDLEKRLDSKGLREKYKLEKGEGLCFVDEYHIQRTEEGLEIVPQPQKLHQFAQDDLRDCVEAHLKLHKGLCDHSQIPVPNFPGIKAGQEERTPIEIITDYYEKRKTISELVIPLFSMEKEKDYDSGRAELLRIDLSSLNTSYTTIKEGEDMFDSIMRYVDEVEIKGEKRIVCCFKHDYALVDPETGRVVETYKLKKEPWRKKPHGKTLEEHAPRAKINSFAVGEDKIFLSHYYYGLVSINFNTGQENQIKIAKDKGDEPIREAKINHADGNVYCTLGNSIIVHDQAENFIGEHRSEKGTPSLECLAFDGQDIYASTDRNRALYNFILHGRIGNYRDNLTPLLASEEAPTLKGDILYMECFKEENQSYLFYSQGRNGIIYQLIKDEKGRPPQVRKKELFSAQDKIQGIKHHLHHYMSTGGLSTAGKVYEIDSLTKKQEVLWQGDRKKIILPTMAVSNRQR